jgi:hypothetical protein
MDGGRVVTVLTVVDRGLHCDGCGQETRADTHVLAAEDGPEIALLTGCTTCRTGLYAPR